MPRLCFYGFKTHQARVVALATQPNSRNKVFSGIAAWQWRQRPRNASQLSTGIKSGTPSRVWHCGQWLGGWRRLRPRGRRYQAQLKKLPKTPPITPAHNGQNQGQWACSAAAAASNIATVILPAGRRWIGGSVGRIHRCNPRGEFLIIGARPHATPTTHRSWPRVIKEEKWCGFVICRRI